MRARRGSPLEGGFPANPHDKERYVRRLFDEIAGVYDPMNRILTFGLWSLWQRRLLRRVQESAPVQWLDVACGTADLAILLAQHVPSVRRVVGVDIAPAMLARGREKVARRHLEQVITLQEGNALALPFPDASFDGASIGFALRNVADLGRALAEMRRVVRPGGLVISLEVSRPEHPVVRAGFYAYFYHVVPLLGLLAGKGSAPYRWLPASFTSFPGRRELEQRFREAGLVRVQSEPLTLGVAALHLGRVPMPEEAPERG